MEEGRAALTGKQADVARARVWVLQNIQHGTWCSERVQTETTLSGGEKTSANSAEHPTRVSDERKKKKHGT